MAGFAGEALDAHRGGHLYSPPLMAGPVQNRLELELELEDFAKRADVIGHVPHMEECRSVRSKVRTMAETLILLGYTSRT